MIKVEQISKSFKDTQILYNISFEIKNGDFVAVMGPSGSGKSTLLYSISGMDSISDGRVLFKGINISEMQENELSRFRLIKMGFVFQNPQMLKNLSIFDNIILPGLVAKKKSADDIRKRALELMKQMEIEGIGERDIREVSGGQLQRASICRAMINNPEILFLDEPTGSLNSAATDQVMAILENLNRDGMTIMTVTHDPRVAAKARKVLYIRDGQIAACKEFSVGVDRERELDKWLKGFHSRA
ncbi:putative ABC transport system ATP-binding protein [Anaerovirgula multivorans]|uniref:Putative ABC transport system ATP-binding protein n=1 Tax=Anaerovirgula multivorans TaxID=312168 RepID=A0A239ICZ2_9FIRM|nr:ABC transporter ATP-binding protein [Anaerovirgula multivorans]SNS91108.1 putative ABC transport system ATP-binding protein [Anaerovirgula multivorans]